MKVLPRRCAVPSVQPSGEIAEHERERHRLRHGERDFDAGAEREVFVQEWFCKTTRHAGYSGNDWKSTVALALTPAGAPQL